MILLLFFVFGCTKEEETEKAAPTGEIAAPVIDEATAATITGKVLFEGTPPEMKPVKMETEAICHQKNIENPIYTEKVVVNENGTLKNVFVYVKEGLNLNFPPPKEPVVFDQKTCWYYPHVFGIQVGQPLKILNRDMLLHNVHILPKKQGEINLGMPGTKKMAEEGIIRKFQMTEVMIKIKCDVHSWMNAWVGVLEHPYYSVTGKEGIFNLKPLPPGEYVIEAWHEQYGTLTQKITVGPKETKEITFTFKS